MQQFREVSRTRTNGKLVQFFQDKCKDMVTGCQENESCSKVYNCLEMLDDGNRSTHREIIALIKP